MKQQALDRKIKTQEKAAIKGIESHANFKAGNEYWRLASNFLRNHRKIQTPEELLNKFCDYINHLDANPLMESKLVSFQGESTIEQVPKMKAGTITGACLWIGIHLHTWKEWKIHRQELCSVIQYAERTLFERKFNGASAGLLNAAIIIRDLGLVDKTEVSGPGGGPIETITADMTPQQAAEAYARTLNPDQE